MTLDSLGITNSASHSEIKIAKDGRVRIIEIGGRMGGDCIGSDLVKYSTGIDYVRAVIQVACGEKPELTPIDIPRSAEIRFIITENDHKEFLSMLHDNPQRIIKVAFYHPENIGAIRDSSDRTGCYVVSLRTHATWTLGHMAQTHRLAGGYAMRLEWRCAA